MRLVFRAAFWTWFLTALAAGRFEWLERLPVPAIQGILFVITAVLLAAYFRLPALRARVDELDVRALVLLHVSRFVGIYFLVLHQRGELPYAFAVPGGWGDNLTAFLALCVVFVPLREEIRRHAILIWNTIGLVDIVLVVATAARFGLTDPDQLRAFRHLPLSMLPTFLVPLIIATHVIIYVRLARPAAEPDKAG